MGKIVQVAAEFAPLAKAGGLGEVVVGLSRELTRVHETVEVILPKYNFIPSHSLSNLQVEVTDFKAFENGSQRSNTMWRAAAEGCSLHLLEPHHPAGYFSRDKIYGYEDDIARFLYFSKAVVEYLKLKQEPIDILHLHDWHVAAIAPLIRCFYKQEIDVKGIVLSIHNIEYQGLCASHDLQAIGLPSEPFQTDDARYPSTLNTLKAGLLYADAWVAVSPTYAEEILFPSHSFHLDPTLRKYRSKLCGILNGIDLTLWDPAKDPYIKVPFSASDSIQTITTAKRKNRPPFSKSPKQGPWVGAVTRLVPQKGPELIEAALHHTVEAGGTFLLLGSSPIPALQRHFEELQKTYRNHPQVAIHLEYDEALAHQIYAALDFLIVPSHFEPCGLTQMIAMRYGTIPIVRATGGLKDTVIDCDNASRPAERRNGFVFADATLESLQGALDRAFHLWRSDPSTLQTLLQRGMRSDFGWQKPAKDYLKLYKKLSLRQ